MAERSAAQRRPGEEQGLVSATLTRVSQALVLLVVSLLFSIAMEWIGMAFYWPEQGARHSATMLETELGYLDTDFRQSAIIEDPARFARKMGETLQEWLYRKSGIEAGLIWLAKPPENPGRLRRALASAIHVAADYVLAAMIVSQVFAVRLAILVLALPAFAILGTVALADGLATRDLRRWGGGRESSFVYHWAKRTVTPAFAAPWIIYLSVPFSIHPNWVVMPFAVLFAIAIGVVTRSFKKYL